MAPTTTTNIFNISNTGPVIVLDNGAATIKLAVPSSSRHHNNNNNNNNNNNGRADSTASSSSKAADRAVTLFPNAIARTRSGDRKTSSYIADQIIHSCPDYAALHLRTPLERGFVTDWAAQKAVWDRAIGTALAATAAAGSRQKGASGTASASASGRLLEGRTVIVTEPYFNLPELGEAYDTLLFEEYGIHALWRTTAAQLVAHAPIFSDPAGPSSRKTSGTASAPSGDADASSTSQPPANAASSSSSTSTSTPRPSKRARTSRSAAIAASSNFGNTSASAETKGKARARDSKAGAGIRKPECMLVLDCGHSFCHAVPIVRDEVQWAAVRRLDIGGKLLTNLLKETLSFRQWDMMDETWLTNALKEACCFVAAEPGKGPVLANVNAGNGRNGGGNGQKGKITNPPGRPSEWSFAQLLEMSHANPRSNPILQEYVLPDYTSAGSSKYGHIRRGPGAQPPSRPDPASASASTRKRKIGAGAEGSTDPSASGANSDVKEVTADTSSAESWDSEDDFIADKTWTPSSSAMGSHRRRTSADEDDEDEDEDEDGGKGPQNTEEEEQVLVMNSERFAVPEVLFCPAQIDLDQAGLAELVESSINAVADEDLRGLLWGNVVLVGGGAKLAGIKRRLERELRALAPDEFSVRIWLPDDPITAAAQGGLALSTSLSSAPSSQASQFLRSRLVTRAEYEARGSAVCRGRFGGWEGYVARNRMRGSGDGSGGASGSGGAEGGKVTERGEELLAVGAGAGAEQAVYAPEVVRREEKGARERRAQERRSRARVEVV